MNQVSWLIYLADILGNLGSLLIFIGVVISIVGVAYFIHDCVLMDNIRYSYGEDKDTVLKKMAKHRRSVGVAIFFSFLFWVAAALCPSKDTVLAIAASQFGEQLLHTKTASLAEKALNTWLEKQINHVKPAAATTDK